MFTIYSIYSFILILFCFWCINVTHKNEYRHVQVLAGGDHSLRVCEIGFEVITATDCTFLHNFNLSDIKFLT